jgi:SP family sugar:H+ symporter-like MFS transporter
MIVFACLFIGKCDGDIAHCFLSNTPSAAFAMTWGPIIWAIIGELYPTRYRAICMGIATAANWGWNFLISFFTPFITGAIDYRYGYVFASCCFLGAVVVYFFLCESQGKSLEEIDTMYILHVPPRKSSKWTPPEDEELVTTDKLALTPGARGIHKERPNDAETMGSVQAENVGELSSSGARVHH